MNEWRAVAYAHQFDAVESKEENQGLTKHKAASDDRLDADDFPSKRLRTRDGPNSAYYFFAVAVAATASVPFFLLFVVVSSAAMRERE